MKTTISGRDCWLAVVSIDNPMAVQSFPLPATWVVPEDQAAAYALAGATVFPSAFTSLAAGRNVVLAHAAGAGLDAVILDDSPQGAVRHWFLDDDGKAQTLPINHHRALELIIGHTLQTGCSLGSASHVLSAGHVKTAVSHWGGGFLPAVTYVPHGGPGLIQAGFLDHHAAIDFAVEHAVHGNGFCRVDEVLWKCAARPADPEASAAEASLLRTRWAPQLKISPKGQLLMDVQPRPWVGPLALSGTLASVHSLVKHPKNARVHDLKAIAASLEANGQVRPVVVNRRTSHILKGNGTFTAATLLLGWTEIAVTWVDVDSATELRILTVDNRSSELGWFDDAMLADLLRDLPDLGGTGYDDKYLADLEKSLGGPLLPPAPKDGKDVKDKAKKKFDLSETKSLTLVSTVDAHEQLVADLHRLRQGEESIADTVARLIQAAESAA